MLGDCALGLVRSQKVKHKMITRPSNSTAKYILRERKAGAQADICPLMLTAALFTTARKMATTQMSISRGMDSRGMPVHGGIYFRETFLASKRSGLPIYAAMGMDLEAIMQREVSQAQRDKCSRIPLMRSTLTRSIHADRKQKRSYPELEGGADGYRPVWDEEKLLMVVMVTQQGE